jgi:hypothetical protein
VIWTSSGVTGVSRSVLIPSLSTEMAAKSSVLINTLSGETFAPTGAVIWTSSGVTGVSRSVLIPSLSTEMAAKSRVLINTLSGETPQSHFSTL